MILLMKQGMQAGRLTRQKPAGVSQEDALACAHIQDLEEVHACEGRSKGQLAGRPPGSIAGTLQQAVLQCQHGKQHSWGSLLTLLDTNQNVRWCYGQGNGDKCGRSHCGGDHGGVRTAIEIWKHWHPTVGHAMYSKGKVKAKAKDGGTTE